MGSENHEDFVVGSSSHYLNSCDDEVLLSGEVSPLMMLADNYTLSYSDEWITCCFNKNSESFFRSGYWQDNGYNKCGPFG